MDYFLGVSHARSDAYYNVYLISGYALVQIPDFLSFLYDQYKKYFGGEIDSKEKEETRIDKASLEAIIQQLIDDTLRKNGTLDVLNQSKFSESQDARLDVSKSGSGRSIKMANPSRLPIYIAPHKINSIDVMTT